MLAFILGGAVLAVVAAIVLGNLTRDDGTPNSPATARVAPAEGRMKGSATAPVTMVEYADLQCPNCARFALTTEPELEQKYVATGMLKIEARQFAFLGRESVRAAEANECAGEQGKFWEYRDALYAAQRGENRGAFSDRNLRAIADRTGLDGGALAACLDSGRYSERVRSEREIARASGVSATPTFFINGQTIVGAQPLAVFEAAIEQALAQAGAGR
jgi:protein-disulfide isomerase